MTDNYRMPGDFCGQRPYTAKDIESLFDLSEVIIDPKGIRKVPEIKADKIVEQSLSLS